MRDKVVTKCFLLVQAAHTFYITLFSMYEPPPPHPTARFLAFYYVLISHYSYFYQPGQHLLFL